MAEAVSSKELLPDIKFREDVFRTWEDDLRNATTSAEREGIWAAINAGISKGQKEIKEASNDEVKRMSDEMAEKERKARRRSDIERNVDEFMKNISKHSNLIDSGPSHPKDSADGRYRKEILRDKKDWSQIGWGEEDTKRVKDKFAAKFGDEIALDEKQVVNMIELFVATGKTPREIETYIDNSAIEEPTEDDIKRAGSLEKAWSMKKLIWFSRLGIQEKYVERFILQEDFRDELEREYQSTDPSNIEEIAWQVMHHYGHKTWGPNGTFPLLEMRIGYVRDEKGNLIPGPDGKPQVDEKKSKYYINQANFVRWARERMWNLWDINNDVGDFVGAIDLPKTYGKMDFGRMFPEYTKYFASEDGETHYWLMAQELIIESVGLGTMNQMASRYRQEMRDPDGLQKAIGEMFASNAFTKETFRKNLFQLMTIIPLNYEGHQPGELLNNDGIFGAAMMDMFLVYYNLSDYDELQRILGKGSSFFTRDGYMQALQTVMADKSTESSGESHPTLLNAETQEWFRKAFDKNGQVTTEENRDNFIKLVNFFPIKVNNEDAEYTVRRMMYRVITEKYGRVLRDKDTGKELTETLYLTDPVTGETTTKTIKKYGLTSDVEGTKDDEWTLKMAWVAAHGMSRIFGAGARNDHVAAGYDGFTKMHLLEIYRNKMLNKNADESGNPYTVHQFKMLAMDPMNAIVTESFKEMRDRNGAVVRDKEGHAKVQAKTFLEVAQEIQATMTALTAQLRQREEQYNEEKDPDRKEELRKQLDEFRKEKNRKYQNKAGELAFKARAMSNYYDDHLMRAHETWKVIMGAEEMEFEDYTTYDAWGGVSFDREKFQKDVQHKWIHPIRYFLNTYPDVNYNQRVRMLDQAATISKGKPIYREMALGEAMFGHELLNREQFWLRDEKGKPILMRDASGRKMKGIYEIDYDKVNANKIQVWKQFFLTKLVGDLWAHRSFHAPDKRYDLNYYNSVVKAIETIPGAFVGDEFNIRQQVSTKNFFDKHDMQWFKKNAKVENYDLFLRAFFKDILLPDERDEGIGLLLALSLATRHIVRQGS